MNDHDHNRWRDELAAYMLGALDRDEASDFERHLEGCEHCQEEMRWLQPALQTLPEAVERQKPPRQLREALMSEVRDDAREARGRAATARPRRRWFLRPAVGFAVVALLVAGVAGYELGTGGSGGGGGSSTIERQVDGIAVKMVREGDGGSLQLDNVDQVEDGKVLEAWVNREGTIEAVPALFVPDRNGRAETRIADMGGVKEVMVTEEPSGGSETPTSAPIVAISVPS